MTRREGGRGGAWIAALALAACGGRALRVPPTSSRAPSDAGEPAHQSSPDASGAAAGGPGGAAAGGSGGAGAMAGGPGGATSGTSAAGGLGGAGATSGTGAAGGPGTSGVGATSGTGFGGSAGFGGSGFGGAGSGDFGGGSGQFGQGGIGGAVDAGPPPIPPDLCANVPSKPLPYAIQPDFQSLLFLNFPAWLTVPEEYCNQTDFPDVPSSAPDGIDGGADSGDAGQASPVGTDGGAPLPPVSSCYAFEYLPDACVAQARALAPDAATDPSGMMCWSGVILTPTPSADLGPGVCIAPGATAIHFKARSSRDGARVKFGAIRAGLGTTEFYLSLSRAWLEYAISIPPGDPYDQSTPLGGVWNGFSIVAEPQDHPGGTYIFVSDVVWSAE